MSRTLLLSPWYFPMKILRWQDAVTMMYLDKAEVVVSYKDEIRSVRSSIKMPAVLRLKRAIRATKRAVKFSRVNVYTRDKFTCQFCNTKLPWSQLTYDHVVPRAAGGRTEWENIVTACRPCNSRKDSRSCDESGMWPTKAPARPKSLPLTPPLMPDSMPDEWLAFVKDIPA